MKINIRDCINKLTLHFCVLCGHQHMLLLRPASCSLSDPSNQRGEHYRLAYTGRVMGMIDVSDYKMPCLTIIQTHLPSTCTSCTYNMKK